MGCNGNDASWWKSRKISRWDANNILMKSLFTSESMLTSQDRAVKISIKKFVYQICILNCKYISHQRARWPTELQQWKECDLTGQLSYSIFWQVLDILISFKLKVLTDTIPQGKTHFNSQFSKFSKHSLTDEVLNWLIHFTDQTSIDSFSDDTKIWSFYSTFWRRQAVCLTLLRFIYIIWFLNLKLYIS